jgi:hypothetical protein
MRGARGYKYPTTLKLAVLAKFYTTTISPCSENSWKKLGHLESGILGYIELKPWLGVTNLSRGYS